MSVSDHVPLVLDVAYYELFDTSGRRLCVCNKANLQANVDNFISQGFDVEVSFIPLKSVYCAANYPYISGLFKSSAFRKQFEVLNEQN